MTYTDFLDSKAQLSGQYGFKPLWLPDYLFDFQKHLVDWALMKGRAALYEDCGLGKSVQEIVWAENVVRHTNGRVLLLTPLAVGHHMVAEGEKFGVELKRSNDGRLPAKIVVTNYERLHYLNPNDFDGVVCDEAGILKNVDGATRSAVIEFMRKVKFRLLATATPSPNDYIELGNSSEALGELGFMDMLGRFFKKAESTCSRSDEFRSGTYRFRGHAQRDFWRWVVSWARAVRKPSDLGFSDDKFILPPLNVQEHVIAATTRRDGFLFDLPAMNLEEQRDERRRTIPERCEAAAKLVTSHDKPSVVWCNLNAESDLLHKLIPGSEEIVGSDSDEHKEEVIAAFEAGKVKRIITKGSITGWGCNWQHCAHAVYFPDHSFEKWYQSIRRFWRFGQKNPVNVDVVCSEGETRVLANLQRKAEAAEKMFENLVALMNNELKIVKRDTNTNKTEVPTWLQNKTSETGTHSTAETVAKSSRKFRPTVSA
jgi:hypothetical protein